MRFVLDFLTVLGTLIDFAGEFANLFTLFLRAIGLKARYGKSPNTDIPS